ncbi:hypothetical protein ACWDR0_31590 [Streptomyces sp. NPDC003691]
MPSTPPAPAAVPDPVRGLATLLKHAYDLGNTGLTRLLAGQTTVNYRTTDGDETLFVKHYPPGADLAAETSPCTKGFGAAICEETPPVRARTLRFRLWLNCSTWLLLERSLPSKPGTR